MTDWVDDLPDDAPALAAAVRRPRRFTRESADNALGRTQQAMNARQIRALAEQVLIDAKLTSFLRFDEEDGCSALIFRDNADAALIAVEVLAAAGLLPTRELIRANLDRCYATDWQPPEGHETP